MYRNAYDRNKDLYVVPKCGLQGRQERLVGCIDLLYFHDFGDLKVFTFYGGLLSRPWFLLQKHAYTFISRFANAFAIPIYLFHVRLDLVLIFFILN